MKLKTNLICMTIVVTWSSLCVVRGQEAPKSTAPKADPAKQAAPMQEPPSTEATIERIVEQAVKNIARRYNLNSAQLEETDKLMKREVRKFLKEHEAVVWPLIRDLLVAQMNGKAPENKEDVMRIGKAAKPLSKMAQDAIIRANMEWRQILTAEQLKMHDFDLQEMQKTFGQIDKNFSDWEVGSPTPGPVIPPGDAAGSPPKPKQPPPGLPGPERRFLDPDVFEAIVEKFIKDYEPDQGQKDAARSLLEETKTKAKDFQNSNKDAIEALDQRQNAARANRNHEELAAVDADRKKLLEPYHMLVHELETRLNGLLTTAQIEKHAQSKQATDAKPKDPNAKPPPKKAPAAAKPNPAAPVAPPAAEPPKPDPAKDQTPPSGRP